jgi:1,4-dihydroxy-2-naphthoyl-CoA synthase
MATTAKKTNGSAADRSDGATRAPQQIRESVRALQRDTRDLVGALEQLSTSVGDALREQMDRRPYAAMGVGLVAGYVLGGGLSFRLASLLGAAAARAAMVQMVSQGVGSVARGGRES